MYLGYSLLQICSRHLQCRGQHMQGSRHMDGSPQRHGQLERDSATMTDTTDEESVEATQPEPR